MKKPFVIINFEEKEILVVVKTYCRTVKFEEIDKNEEFFYELFRRHDGVNFASKYSEMNKKDFLKLIDDLSEAIKAEKKEEEKEEILAFQEPVNQEEETADEEYRYIMSNTEKRFSMDDLGIIFSHKGENYEVALIGQDKVDKSEYLKVFLKNGMAVMATASMVRETQSEYLKKSRTGRRKPGGLDIVDREDMGGVTEASDIQKMDINDSELDDMVSTGGSDNGLEYDAFSNTTGDPSLDALMKGMKN
jgi:hypothetical protein